MSGTDIILSNVPRVAYGPEGCTPFPMCLWRSAEYIGIPATLPDTMAMSGAAFRLTWDTGCWNPGNVDVIHTYADPARVYRQGFEGLGRQMGLMTRTTQCLDIPIRGGISSDARQSFAACIREELEAGRPVIALGIIGPPEACIVTGILEDDETLLGWNFFQDFPEMAGPGVETQDGYFRTREWWENKETSALMTFGDTQKEGYSLRTILKNGAEALEGRKETVRGRPFAKGLEGYSAWRQALLREDAFPEGMLLPLLAERLMCHGDAMDCVADGRHHAGKWLRMQAEKYPVLAGELNAAAGDFEKTRDTVYSMYRLLGGFSRDEAQMRKLAQRETREQLAVLIDVSRDSDARGLEKMQQMVLRLA